MEPQRAAHLVDEHLSAVAGDADETYLDLHQHPELSFAEHRTAALVASRLADAGFTVRTGIGGTGVLGVLTTGPGPVVALRGDMDALPIVEATGLDYASTVTAETDHGVVGVMHACGHDMHIAALLGAAALLAGASAHWSGTVAVVAQPAEEALGGAEAMMADRLWADLRPDVLLGQHTSELVVGRLGHKPGVMMAAARNLAVRLHGVGGHGAYPHTTVDPVVLAAQFIVAAQTVVARLMPPTTLAIVTVGSVHAGTAPNIIAPYADLQITTRGLDSETLDAIQAHLERIATGLCAAAGSPQPPEFSLIDQCTAVVNDLSATEAVQAVHSELFGVDALYTLPVVETGSEDFGALAQPWPGSLEPPQVPAVYWNVGVTPRALWDHADGDTEQRMLAVPGIHTPFFAPDRASVTIGIRALAGAALAFLAPR